MKKALVLSFLLRCKFLCALPQNPAIIEGQAHFLSQEKQLAVTAQDRSIIQWEDFSIAAQETVHFHLPHVRAAVLNRVGGADPSLLFGQLLSNGTVYLINPHGILVGEQGVIQVGSFLASTLDVSNRDFLEGKELFFKGTSRAVLENRGHIEALYGDVVLVSALLKNEGIIDAAQGVIACGAGQEVLYLPHGDERIQVRLSSAKEIISEEPGIHQQGCLRGMHTELKADGNLYSFAIKNEGMIEAIGVEYQDGYIHLVAEKGVVNHSGSLVGNEVKILGEHTRITDAAEIDASGSLGGGTILIGGDYQGQNPLIANAYTSLVEKDVIIKADALEEGNGGKIVVWADDATGFYGKASVRGGLNGGDGGFVEVSGKNVLEFLGLVDAGAAQGRTGELLLDPTNITISNAADASITFTACPTGTYTPTGAPATATINIPTLLTNLAGTCNISITTASGAGSAGTITIAAPITRVDATANTLTLNANSAININASVANNSTGGGSMTFNSGTTASSTLTLAAAATLSQSSSGTMTLNSSAVATSDLSIIGAVSITGGNLTITVADDFTSTAGTGSINFNSPGNMFIFTTTVPTNSVATFNGAVTIDGNSLFTTAGTLNFNSTVTTSGTGTMTINSTGTTTFGAASVVNYDSTGDLSITSTGTGSDIVVNGTFNVSAANATFFPNDDFTLAATTGAMLFSAAGKTLTFNSGPTSTCNFNGTLNVSAGDLSVTAFDDITIAATTGSIVYSSPGGTCIFNSSGGVDPDFNINGIFTINDGTLTMSTFDDIIVGTAGVFTYNTASTASISAVGTDGDIAINGTMTVTNGSIVMSAVDSIASGGASTVNWSSPGTWTMNALGTDVTLGGTYTISNGDVVINAADDITLSAASFTWTSPGSLSMTTTIPASTSIVSITSPAVSFSNGEWSIDSQGDIITGGGSVVNYTAPNAFTMLSHLGNITFNGPITLNTPAPFSLTASVGDIAILSTVVNNSTGQIVASAADGFLVGLSIETEPSQIGSAGGLTQITAGGDMEIQASTTTPGATAFVGYSFGGQSGNVVIDVSGNAMITGGGSQNAGIVSPGSLAMTVGQNIVLTSTLAAANSGQALISANGPLSILTNNISLISSMSGPQTRIDTTQGNLLLIANNSFSALENSLVTNLGSGNLTIVVDQQAPFPPQVGPGQFNLFGNAMLSTNGGELQIFTASPGQNQVQGLVNGAQLAQGNQVYGVWYSTFTGYSGAPFTIYYKIGENAETSFFALGVASAEVTQEGLDRAMGWAWMSPFELCGGHDLGDYVPYPSREHLLFKRKPFEYPIYLPSYERSTMSTPAATIDPYRVQF